MLKLLGNARFDVMVTWICFIFVVCSSVDCHPHYLVLRDRVAANSNYLKSLNRTCVGKRFAPGLKCRENMYCVDSGFQQKCLPLPGFYSPNPSLLPQPIDYCKNCCGPNEVKTLIPGGCQCTCPPCFSASSLSNSTCTLNTSCCGPNSILSIRRGGSVVCTCQIGYQWVNGECASTSKTTTTASTTTTPTTTTSTTTTTTTTTASQTTARIAELINGNGNLGTNLGTI